MGEYLKLPHTYNLNVYAALHRKGKREGVEGVKLDADVATRLAPHLGLELAVEQVHYHRLVTQQVVVPRLQHNIDICQHYCPKPYNQLLICMIQH